MRVFRPAALKKGVRIAATGIYLPERLVQNADIAAAGAPIEPEEMLRLCGIETRHWVAPEEATSDLAANAARAAMRRAGISPDEVDRLILGTVSPDYMSPSAACIAQKLLSLRPVPAFDVAASCSGFLYVLDLAARAIVTGDDCVVVIAADVRSRFLDHEDRGTCALFGDGAGAAVLTSGPIGAGLIGIGLLADGSGAHSVYVPAGGSREPASEATVAKKRHMIQMAEGPKVYLAAVEGMVGTGEALLGALELGWSDVDWVVPHQPNRRILDRLARLAGFPPDKLVINIDRHGNMSAASVAVAFDELLRDERVTAGQRVLLIAAGAGYTAGAALVVVDDDLLVATRSRDREGE